MSQTNAQVRCLSTFTSFISLIFLDPGMDRHKSGKPTWGRSSLRLPELSTAPTPSCPRLASCNKLWEMVQRCWKCRDAQPLSDKINFLTHWLLLRSCRSFVCDKVASFIVLLLHAADCWLDENTRSRQHNQTRENEHRVQQVVGVLRCQHPPTDQNTIQLNNTQGLSRKHTHIHTDTDQNTRNTEKSQQTQNTHTHCQMQLCFVARLSLEPTRMRWKYDQVRTTSLETREASVQECNGVKSVCGSPLSLSFGWLCAQPDCDTHRC